MDAFGVEKDSKLDGVGSQPCGQLLLAQRPVSEVQKRQVELLLGGLDIPAISYQENGGHSQRRPLVSIHKRMVAGDAKGIGRSQPVEIDALLVRDYVLRLSLR